MADAQASGACGSNIVWVQVPSPAYQTSAESAEVFSCSEDCDKEGPTKWEDALSPSNELCSLQKVSPERTTRKSEAAKLRRYEVAGFSSLKEDCDKEVSPERSVSCIKDA